MATAATVKLDILYQTDETAWLETMSERIRLGQLDDLDYSNLGEYLADMARRDRREVTSRLASLIAHLLKWRYQPERRSGRWRATVEVQRQELVELLESGTLRNHAVATLGKAYSYGVRQASAETGLPEGSFPEDCPYSMDEILSGPMETDPA